MKNPFPRLKTITLSDRIARSIEDAILSGTLRSGSALNCDGLARQFSVSRIPVREALQKLEALGLVVQTANKSARIFELSATDITNIFQVRQTLEGLAISLAAHHLESGEKQRLQSLVKRMRALVRSRDYPKLFAADKEFHRTIWNLSGNQFLVRILSRLLLPYFGFIASRGYHIHQDDPEYVPRVHQEILDALSTRDGDHAQSVIVKILERSRQLMPIPGAQHVEEEGSSMNGESDSAWDGEALLATDSQNW